MNALGRLVARGLWSKRTGTFAGFLLLALALYYLYRTRTRLENSPPSPRPRRRILKGRKVTLSGLGVCLIERSDERIRYDVIPEVVPALLDLAENNDLYIITHVPDDEAVREVEAAFEAVGLFDVKGVRREKVLLVHSTRMGRASMVRQIDPLFHIDHDLEIVNILKPHISNVVLVSSHSQPTCAKDIHVTSSLLDFLRLCAS